MSLIQETLKGISDQRASFGTLIGHRLEWSTRDTHTQKRFNKSTTALSFALSLASPFQEMFTGTGSPLYKRRLTNWNRKPLGCQQNSVSTLLTQTHAKKDTIDTARKGTAFRIHSAAMLKRYLSLLTYPFAPVCCQQYLCSRTAYHPLGRGHFPPIFPFYRARGFENLHYGKSHDSHTKRNRFYLLFV